MATADSNKNVFWGGIILLVLLISAGGYSFFFHPTSDNLSPIKTDKKIQVFTLSTCRYCTMAKDLLKKRGLAFDEIEISRKPLVRKMLKEKTGGQTSVPQIFIDNKHIGGFRELSLLEQSGKLEKLLTLH